METLGLNSAPDRARRATVSAVVSSNPLRLLYVIDGLRAGGKERQTVELLCGLADRGVLIQVVSLGSDRFFASELERSGIVVIQVERGGRRDLRPFAGLNRVFRKFRPAVVHSTCWMSSFFALPLCRWHGVPLVNGSIRNAFAVSGLKPRVERWLLQLADMRIANSRAGFVSRGLDPQGLGNQVVYNGFDFRRLNHRESPGRREIEAFSAGRQVVGMVAQFKRDKDHPTFLLAADMLLRKRDDVSFVLIGDGQQFESVRAGYRDRAAEFWFTGRRPDVESLVDGLSVGVLATFTEGISNAIMEYMALGKPVVATDGGGTAELVVEGRTGFLVSPRDPVSLADRIGRLLDSPALARLMGEQGRQRLQSLFSRDALLEQTLNVYNRIITQRDTDLAPGIASSHF